MEATTDNQNEVVQLSPQETFIISSHANVRMTAAERLTEEENRQIQHVREELHRLMKANGDAGRVALMLFQLEFDNSPRPFDGKFDEMVSVDWETALQLWKEGYIDPEKL